ncbi:MAG: deoxyguanosinetriphosphate triphosphohydrolase [Anaerolineae bacterium]|nr:deoxyguanosinetriphosphate triphosphohydrolase [Anaerolineae bacterium]
MTSPPGITRPSGTFLTREEWEEQERRWLAPWAMRSADTRGRQYPDPERPYRTAFQRDRDRVVHTTAFRRLEYKTQVFVTYEGDYYRTRLTHTIEVAQIARTIARALRANEDLVEAIAMAHDLGHTPFGHTGEATLHDLMQDHGGFDHNHQTLRIVTRLERRYPDFPGLNLTWEVREGIIKHKTEYDRGQSVEEYEPEWAPTLEGQIVNAADEIAYTTHDLDDGLRAGYLDRQDLEKVAVWNLATDEAGVSAGPLGEVDRHRVIRRLIDLEVTDLIDFTADRLTDLHPATSEDVRRLGFSIVSHSPRLQELNRELKDFLFGNLYRHWRVLRMANKARRFVTRLFEAYVSDPRQLSDTVRRLMQEDGLYRAVADHIAGMTDRFALEEYRKLFDPMVNQ